MKMSFAIICLLQVGRFATKAFSAVAFQRDIIDEFLSPYCYQGFCYYYYYHIIIVRLTNCDDIADSFYLYYQSSKEIPGSPSTQLRYVFWEGQSLLGASLAVSLTETCDQQRPSINVGFLSGLFSYWFPWFDYGISYKVGIPQLVSLLHCQCLKRSYMDGCTLRRLHHTNIVQWIF